MELIKYEDVKNISLEEYYNNNAQSIMAIRNKYIVEECNDKTIADIFKRVADYAASNEETNELKIYWSERWFHEMWTEQWMSGGSILQAAANPKKVSLANCTTIGFADDSTDAIYEAERKVAKCAAARQGIGIHFNLRPKGAKINNAANISSGNVHWMKKINTVGEYFGQAGRRPAILFSLSSDNYDLPEFIKAKSDQTTIDNANISIQFKDVFMHQLIDSPNSDWCVEYKREDETLTRKMNISELFDMFIENNWAFAEPGAQFIDTSKRLSNSDYLSDKRLGVVSSNACSEQNLEFYDKFVSGICMLASVNFIYLYRMFKNDLKAACDYLRYELSPSIHRFMDNIIQKEIDDKRYPIKEQLNSLKLLRRMGVGFTNLDGYLICNNIPYDSDEGINTTFKLADSLNVGLYESSIKLGKERGSFEAFNKEEYVKSPFIQQMIKRHNLKFDTMRNVCLTSVAPTGSLSLLFKELFSYGIEPIMGLYYWKRNRTSGKWVWMFCVAPFVRPLMKELGVDLPMNSDTIEDDDNGSRGEAIALIIDKHFPKDKYKPAHLINPFKKIEMISKLTKHCVDSSISVTYNLPEDVDKETIKQIYIDGWKAEVKGISIYRDKSRVGVIEFESPRIASKRFEIDNNTHIKRPQNLLADVHHITVKGEKWISFVGLNEGKPYEIFTGKEDEVSLPKIYKNGLIEKDRNKYYFISGSTEEDTIRINISNAFKNDEFSALTRQISLSLRNKVPLIEIIKQLDKSHGTVIDFSKVLMRVFKNYIDESDINGAIKCQDCGSRNLSYQEKCFVCKDCGSSKCS